MLHFMQNIGVKLPGTADRKTEIGDVSLSKKKSETANEECKC